MAAFDRIQSGIPEMDAAFDNIGGADKILDLKTSEFREEDSREFVHRRAKKARNRTTASV